ncbi:hypothetical protein HY415_02275 [Candidatus Kaiserbacteria bacterium]|nr:hypothetical protein [Candidatus Kaiserbacteria bacterium]
MLTSKQASLLGMLSQEKKILNLLITSKNNLTATAISKHVSEPRTTVNFYLGKLLHKGWTKKVKSPESPYPLWCLNDKSNIRDTILSFFTLVGVTPAMLTTVTAKEGYEQIKAAYEKILEVGKTERVFVIQGSRAPSAVLKNLPIEFIEEMHATQKQKPIILEGITGEKGLLIFNNMTPRELRSHYGRLTVVYLIPDEYLDFDAEIFVFKENIIVIEPESAKSLIIKDENLTHSLRLLISFIEQQGEKVDVNEHIKQLIEHKSSPSLSVS